MTSSKVTRIRPGVRMPIAVNEHLAHLMQVQGGLLDAYLEQNLDKRFAYLIVCWEQLPPSQVRAVTNAGDMRALVRDLADRLNRLDGDALALDRRPTFVDLGP